MRVKKAFQSNKFEFIHNLDQETRMKVLYIIFEHEYLLLEEEKKAKRICSTD